MNFDPTPYLVLLIIAASIYYAVRDIRDTEPPVRKPVAPEPNEDFSEALRTRGGIAPWESTRKR